MKNTLMLQENMSKMKVYVIQYVNFFIAKLQNLLIAPRIITCYYSETVVLVVTNKSPTE